MKANPSDFASHWTLDPDVVFLNHGSFGACPKVVLDRQTELRAQMERESLRFFLQELPPLVAEARAVMAAFLGADPADLAFVVNATQGVNAVLRSFPFKPGDEVLVIDHAYAACKNAVDFVVDRSGATTRVVDIPFPLSDPAEVVSAVMAGVTDRTVLAMLDHVTSPTGIVLPIAELTRALEDRGVDVLVDGAHVPGMFPLDLDALGAHYYTGNAHKWLAAPKGTAVLHVRKDRQDRVRPTSISHAASLPAGSRFLAEFDWPGTDDPTGWLTLPTAINFFETVMPGGFEAVARRNHQLAVQARAHVCAALGVSPAAPESMIGTLANIELPWADVPAGADHFQLEPLQRALYEEWRIQIPVIRFGGRRWIRLSAHLYNDLSQYQLLAHALTQLLRV